MEHFIRDNLRIRTFAAVMLLNFLVILVISIFFQQRSLSFFEQEYADAVYEQARANGALVDSGWQALYQTTADAAFDMTLREKLSAADSQSSETAKEIAAILRDYQNRNAQIDRISLYEPASGRLIRSDEYHSTVMLDPYNEGKMWLDTISQQQGRQPFLGEDLIGAAPQKVYLYHQPVYDKDGQLLAYLTTSCSERRLYYAYLAPIVQKKESAVLLYQADGTLLSGSLDDDEAGPVQTILHDKIAQNPDGQTSLHLHNQDYFAVWLSLPFSGDVFCLIKSQHDFHAQIIQMQVLCVLSALVLLLLSAVFLYWISLRLARPAEELAEAMHEAGRGNLAVRAPVTGSDEISYLALSFNEMLQKMHELIERLASEKEQKKEAELKALQYQIRPHFIYNMLNAIRFAAIMQGARNLGKLLADFVELLRASTNRSGVFSPLSEELDTLRHYISLQEFRLMDAFTVHFSIQDNTLACIVPRMLLQPLVENSILHGPSATQSCCHIEVTAYIKKNALHLIVRDDGQGMTPEQIEELEHKAKTGRPPAHGGLSGIGVHNIMERLHLYYGEKARLHYESDGKSFTKAEITLPVSHDVHEYEI
ncbi:cache domain-containing sensor histidine kinase [Mitsuokella sp. WILCCON 0060]|uniref:cache domain-containing sensor histidine kinase n=1 Tax=Mitsuokella sp. WILCCON 0060 TaxID=3345341 RepID=UPI003F1CDD81